MAIKKTINGAAPIITKQTKAPNSKKTVVGVKKNDQTIINPEEEAIKENETSVIALTDIIQPDERTTHEFTDEELRPKMPRVKDPIDEAFEEFLEYNQARNKKRQEKQFAKIVLAVGIGILVIMMLNKK